MEDVRQDILAAEGHATHGDRHANKRRCVRGTNFEDDGFEENETLTRDAAESLSERVEVTRNDIRERALREENPLEWNSSGMNLENSS